MLEPDDARSLIKDMAERISSNWYKIARQTGLSEKDCDTIQSAFVYPGFWI